MKLKGVKLLSLILMAMVTMTIVLVCITSGVSHAAEGGPVSVGELLDENFAFLDGTYDGDAHDADKRISGWEVDAIGGSYDWSYYKYLKVNDISTISNVTLKKRIVKQTSGKVTLEYRFNIIDKNMDGVTWQLLSSGDTAAVKILTSSGNICYENSSGTVTTLQAYSVNTEYGIKVIADIGAGTADIYVNGTRRAQGVAFRNSVSDIGSFLFSTSKEGEGSLYFRPVKIYIGYSIYEKFISVPEGSMPRDWIAGTSGGTAQVEYWNTCSDLDPYSLKMNDTSSSNNVTFSKTISSSLTGNSVLEYKFILPSKVNGMTAELMSGSTTAVKIATDSGNISYLNSGGTYVSIWNSYLANVWYTIKVVANPSTDIADIYVNGKKQVTSVAFANNVTSLDTAKFSTSAANTGVMWVDDIVLYSNPSDPADYCPAPTPCASTNYSVGVEHFPGSREGAHLGWGMPYRYPEHDLYMGWFDEGNPEAMDWELKYMAEHGIDFFLECWYSINPTLYGQEVPIKDPSYSVNSIEKGYFNSKYSNQVSFAIFDCETPASSVFRNVFVPYWIEHYFKDPRYFKIDNKPVIAFDAGIWESVYSHSQVKAEMDYLRTQLTNAGFAGAILLARVDTNPYKSWLDGCKDMGFDYGYAYSLWTSDLSTMQSVLCAQRDAGSTLGMIPTMSVGWSTEAWDGPYTGRLSTSDFSTLCNWAKNTFMPSLPSESLGRSMVMVDNWSEYGEGHWINPGKLGGFGYVDALRSSFTANPAHTDTIPTDAQKLRINTLFPKGWVGRSWNFDSTSRDDTEGWTSNGIANFGQDGKGYLRGTITATDPILLSRDNLGVAIGNNKYVRIKMKNGGTGNTAKVYFATNTSGISETNSKAINLIPNDSNCTEYIVDMSTCANWIGTLKQLRFDPVNDDPAVGEFSIDSIVVSDEIPTGYVAPTPTPSTNLALSQTASMLSGIPVSGHEASKAVDGSVSTYTQSNAKTNWGFQVDMGSSKSIDQVVMITDTSNYPTDYTIKVSTDNTNWSTVKTMTGEAVANRLYKFPVISARYVKVDVTGTAGSSGWCLYEFQVYNSGNSTSKVWNFDANYNNVEGWTSNSSVGNFCTDGNGYLCGTVNANDPVILSPDNLGISIGSNRYIELSMKNSGPCNNAKIYFATTTSAISETNSKTFSLIPNDQNRTEYVIDMSTCTNWTGTLKQLRVDPVNDEPSSGTFSIDYIELATATPAGYAAPSPTPSSNLAFNKNVSMVNGTPYTGCEAGKAVDGSTSTYAQSNTRVNWGLAVDLGSIQTVNQVVLGCWSDNYPTSFNIKVSTDGSNWITAKTVTGATGGNMLYNFPDYRARYIYIDVTGAYYSQAGTWGWALSEFQAYDTGVDLPSGYWPLGGNATDTVGGNNGTVYGNMYYYFGSARFDGVDDYVSISDSQNLDNVNGFTASTLVTMRVLPAQNYAVINKDYSYRIVIGPSGGYYVEIATSNNGWYTAGTIASGATTLSTGRTYNIVATYDGSYVKVYLNGVLDGTGSQAISGNVADNANPLVFGQQNGSNINWYDGRLGKVIIYDRALTATEISKMYNSYNLY